jgi:hypothetical protein
MLQFVAYLMIVKYDPMIVITIIAKIKLVMIIVF